VRFAVRRETPSDIAAIRTVNEAAFGGDAEAALVDGLRVDGDLVLSLVTEGDGRIVGHCGFSRLTIGPNGQSAKGVALAPVAVLPDLQRRGLGQAMIRQGIAQLRADGEGLILVLGDPDYYFRFGFRSSAAAAFRTPYDGPHLQALSLRGDAPEAGEVRYPRAFAAL
jgi:putative acetyltransferase